MDFEQAFGPDVSPEDFFLEKLPELHRERLENFETFCETTLRFSIHLRDVDERYSVELAPDGARARDGEFIDFPVVTIEGDAEVWGTVKRYALEAFERGERALERQPPPDKIDDAFLADLERYDGVIEVSLEFPELDEPAQFRLILNDYEPPAGARTLRATVGADRLEEVFEGEREPVDAVQSVELTGDMSLGFDLSGIVLEHFPELER